VARTVLIIGAVAWLLVGAAGLVLAAAGTTLLLSLLPPLAIDAEALGGALTAVAVSVIATGAAHLVVVAGLRRDRRWARSAGALLTSVLSVVSLALAAAAISSALREPAAVLPLLGAALVAAFAAAGYALAAVRLVRELGSGPAT